MKFNEMLQKRYSAVFIAPDGIENVHEYASRRRQFLSRVKMPVVLSGVLREPGTEEEFYSTWCRLVQDPAFLYFTGVNQPGCYLWLDPNASNAEREILFLPQKDSFLEFWNGVRLGVGAPQDEAEACALTGFQKVLDAKDFPAFVKKKLQEMDGQELGMIYSPELLEDHHYKFFSEVSTWCELYQKKIENVTELHFQDRFILSQLQIRDLKRATKYTGNAFKTCLSCLKTFKTEQDLGLRLNYEMLKQSNSDLAFPTIVASGKNACCLHYVKNDEVLEQGNLVLLDFGVRSGTVCSDISRTIPVSGKFSPLQKLIYSVVLETQEFHESQVAPGKNLLDLDAKAWEFLNQKLEEVLKKHNGSFKLLYDKRPHGISHFIGEEVHEGGLLPKKNRFHYCLQPGMLISNEPGVYGSFKAEIEGIVYEEILGIRIEDDLLVTEDGCVNISTEIPKKIEDLEEILQT